MTLSRRSLVATAVAVLMASCGQGAPTADFSSPTIEALRTDSTGPGTGTGSDAGSTSESPNRPSSTASETDPTNASASATTSTAAPSAPPTSSTPAPNPGSSVVAPTSAVGGSTTPDPDLPADAQVVALSFTSETADVTTDELASAALTILNDPRGWPRAGFRFVRDQTSDFRVILAEGTRVDELCLPLDTGNFASCQNGPVVALNADRWRGAVDHWDQDLATYRGYLVNHEVGHLIGQRHPTPRCPVKGRPAGVMEQQTGSLAGCTGNAWPRDWEIVHAEARPVVYAPFPDWAPEPVPKNKER